VLVRRARRRHQPHLDRPEGAESVGQVKGALLLLAFGLLLVGCGGAGTRVVAPDSAYPVSLSRGLRDADGNLLTADRRRVVGHFQDEGPAWTIFYPAIRLTPEKDISEWVNQQVKAANGHAVNKLTLTTKHCGVGMALWVFSLLPVWPSCTYVD